ncbi:hypothetical protein Tco_0302888 [Tanacetum coccineum]
MAGNQATQWVCLPVGGGRAPASHPTGSASALMERVSVVVVSIEWFPATVALGGSDLTFTFIFTKYAIIAKKSSNRDSNGRRALKKHASIGANPLSSTEQWVQSFDRLEDEGTKHELSVEALLLLQKSFLEKQWKISTGVNTSIASPTDKSSKKVHVTGSQISAWKQRLDAQKKTLNDCSNMQLKIGPKLFRNQFKGRAKDESTEVLLTHLEVIVLSKKIKTGLNLEEQKLRLKKKLGSEPSEEKLATSMRIPRTNLRTIQIECTLARQKLTLNMIHLEDLRYLPTLIGGYDREFHLHERQSVIRNAKVKLEEQGITPSIDCDCVQDGIEDYRKEER